MEGKVDDSALARVEDRTLEERDVPPLPIHMLTPSSRPDDASGEDSFRDEICSPTPRQPSRRSSGASAPSAAVSPFAPHGRVGLGRTPSRSSFSASVSPRTSPRSRACTMAPLSTSRSLPRGRVRAATASDVFPMCSMEDPTKSRRNGRDEHAGDSTGSGAGYGAHSPPLPRVTAALDGVTIVDGAAASATAAASRGPMLRRSRSVEDGISKLQRDAAVAIAHDEDVATTELDAYRSARSPAAAPCTRALDPPVDLQQLERLSSRVARGDYFQDNGIRLHVGETASNPYMR